MKRSAVVISCVVIVLLAGASLAVFLARGSQGSEQPALGNDVACTEEALLCPDGSAVGRGGADCAFDACPADTPAVKPD